MPRPCFYARTRNRPKLPKPACAPVAVAVAENEGGVDTGTAMVTV